MSGNVSSGGKTAVLAVFAVLAIAAGIAFGAYLRSGPSDTADPAAITAEQPATISAPAEQAASAEGTAENGAVQARGSVELVATDDPLYLSCLEPPLEQNETRDQRVAFCNEQLKQAQAGSEAPAPR